jgi:transposase
VIKLGVDVHWKEYVVVRQIDGTAPQPPQRFTPDGFVAWAAKQVKLADEVHCCYEAGPFGFVLHRRLEKMGVRNRVVRPRNWDEYGKKVKTDRRDALALVGCLDRYLAGNTEALSIIVVPSEQQEQQRAESRQRAQLQNQRRRLASQALGQARYFGFDLEQRWWREAVFAVLSRDLPDHLVGTLARWQRQLLLLDEQIQELDAKIESAQVKLLPVGLGALTAQILEREIGDWTRFKNRRATASYAGLVPSEHSSGGTRRVGSITKHGNQRVRHLLVEAGWRLRQFQPDYRAVKRRQAAFAQAKAQRNSSLRKRLGVGLARELLVDWWRIRTGQVAPEKLGLKMGWPTCPSLRGKRPASLVEATPAATA